MNYHTYWHCADCKIEYLGVVIAELNTGTNDSFAKPLLEDLKISVHMLLVVATTDATIF